MVVLDAPAGIAAAVGPELASVRAVVLTSGRARSLSGLVELLEALAAHRDPDLPLTLHVPLGEERGAALADLWVQHWPGRYPLTVDAERPGATFEVGALTVRTLALRSGEPDWSAGSVRSRVAVGVSVRSGEARAAVLFGAAPEPGLERWCAGADLAVVEVGVVPWPRSDVAWRLRPDEAVAIGQGARELWIVGDDGQRLDDQVS